MVMIKFLKQLSEIRMLSADQITDDQSGAEKYITKYFEIIYSIEPQIKEAYRTNNFTQIYDVFCDAIKPLEEYNKVIHVMDLDNWKDWFKGIEEEDKMMNSSGSYYNAIYGDFDGLHNMFEHYFEDEEELETLIYNLQQ